MLPPGSKGRGVIGFGVLYSWAIVVEVTSFLELCKGDEATEPSESLIVETSHGPVKGYTFTSLWTNQSIFAFHGIPYASPPVGDLRFKDPICSEKWTSVLDCTQDRPSCMQFIDPVLIQLNLTFDISEDCLFINVYTPQMRPEGKLPVMVWVHGGAFIEGSGSRFRFGPDFLVAEGVVVVTLNYRLGAFGFMNLGNSEIPGNMGLKDQRLALQWVQKEIGNFGGDAGNITLFGESAGSASVHLQYLSPLSKGLFHRVIGESGASLSWAVRENGTAYALKLASALNCSIEDSSATHKCLRAASAEAILNAQGSVKPTENGALNGIDLVFVPTVDRFSSEEPFIPYMPKDMIKLKLGSFVPFVMGINSQEGIRMLFRGDSAIYNITKYLDYFIPREVRNMSSPERINFLVERIKSFYFKNSNVPNEIVEGYVDLFTDVMFGYDTAVSAKAFKERSPVYLYFFSFNGLFKEIRFKTVESKYNISGVAHAEEMNYLFIRRKVNQTAPADSREMRTWRSMARMWTNFAKFGKPTVEADPLLQNVSWIPVGQVSTKYLRIDDNITMDSADFLGPSMALWDSITPNAGVPNLQVAGTVALAAVAASFIV